MTARRIYSRLRDLLDVSVSSPTDGEVLTYSTAAGKWENQAGGGGSQPMLSAEIPLTNDQIIALGTQVANLTVVAAPGLGNFIHFLHGLFVVDASTAPYGNIDAQGTWTLSLGETVSVSADNGVLPFLLGGDGEQAIAWLSAQQPIASATLTADYGDRSQLEDFPLILEVWNNNAGPYTGGDVANSGKVKVWYTIETLP